MLQKTWTFALYFFAKIVTVYQKWRCHRSKRMKSISLHYLQLITSNTEHLSTFLISALTSVQMSSFLKIQLVLCFQTIHKNRSGFFISFLSSRVLTACHLSALNVLNCQVPSFAFGIFVHTLTFHYFPSLSISRVISGFRNDYDVFHLLRCYAA